MCFIQATCREKGPQNDKPWAETLWTERKPSIPRFAFNEVSSISKNQMTVELYVF